MRSVEARATASSVEMRELSRHDANLLVSSTACLLGIQGSQDVITAGTMGHTKRWACAGVETFVSVFQRRPPFLPSNFKGCECYRQSHEHALQCQLEGLGSDWKVAPCIVELPCQAARGAGQARSSRPWPRVALPGAVPSSSRASIHLPTA